MDSTASSVCRFCFRLASIEADARVNVGAVALAVLLGALAAVVGTSLFTPDSWAYVELAKTVTTGDFYRFNTFRSYFSDNYSAAFPLGYPVLISLVNLAVGNHPLNSVAINIACASLSLTLLWRISRLVSLSSLGACVVAFSLLLFPGYLDELYAGRAVPAAAFFALAGLHELLRSRSLIGGLLLGVAALTRFDYLAYSLMIILGTVIFGRLKWRDAAISCVGFALGAFPWALYSWTHFEKPWVSDNSWVALSATRAYVLDYPAKAAISAVQAPGLWMERVTWNVPRLARSVGLGCLEFPALLIFGAIFVANLGAFSREQRRLVVTISALIAASMIPYLLTGYLDQRYFGLVFACATVPLIYCIERTTLSDKTRCLAVLGAVGSLAISTLLAAVFTFTAGWAGLHFSASDGRAKMAIKALSICHHELPDVTFIFAGTTNLLASQYGATTRERAAFLPSNFDKLTEKEKKAYFGHMAPFQIVEVTTSEQVRFTEKTPSVRWSETCPASK